jgi:hypothetical protein
MQDFVIVFQCRSVGINSSFYAYNDLPSLLSTSFISSIIPKKLIAYLPHFFLDLVQTIKQNNKQKPLQAPFFGVDEKSPNFTNKLLFFTIHL